MFQVSCPWRSLWREQRATPPLCDFCSVIPAVLGSRKLDWYISTFSKFLPFDPPETLLKCNTLTYRDTWTHTDTYRPEAWYIHVYIVFDTSWCTHCSRASMFGQSFCTNTGLIHGTDMTWRTETPSKTYWNEKAVPALCEIMVCRNDAAESWGTWKQVCSFLALFFF